MSHPEYPEPPPRGPAGLLLRLGLPLNLGIGDGTNARVDDVRRNAQPAAAAFR